MLIAYKTTSGRLAPLGAGEPLPHALWIDLDRPDHAEIAAVEALGITVPTIEEMEEIEISSRLYRLKGTDYMTTMLPGTTADGAAVLAPVTFIVSETRLVTVRHHAPRPFQSFPSAAGRGPLEPTNAAAVFLSLADEVIARFADILEEIGKALDNLSGRVFSDDAEQEGAILRAALTTIGRVGERVGRVRLGLLTMERALTFYGQTLHDKPDSAAFEKMIQALQRDIDALGVHADFVYSRISLIDDATLGMISLEQNNAVKLFSVLAVVFLPPTLVASIYGMNFRAMPELGWPWGYPLALAMMLISAVGTYLFFKWKNWL